MKRHQVMIAGTALALLMGAPQLGAAPFGPVVADPVARAIGPTLKEAARVTEFPLILAQAEEEELPEEDGEPDPEPEAEPEPEPEPDVEPETAPEAEPAPAPEEEQAESEPEPDVEPEAAPDSEGESAEPEPEQAETEPEAPEEQVAPEAEPLEDSADEIDESAEETDAAADDPADEGEQSVEEPDVPAEEPAGEPVQEPLEDTDAVPAEEDAGEEALDDPAEEPVDAAEEPVDDAEAPADATDEPADEPVEEPAEEDESVEDPADEGEDPAVETEEPIEDADQPVEEPAGEDVGEDEIIDESDEPVEGTEESPDELLEEAEPADEGEAIDEDAEAAPLLDSEKEEEIAVEPDEEDADEPVTVFEPLEDAAPPASDAESQRFEEPVEVESLRAIEGQRIDRQAFEPRRQRREGASILDQIQDRFLIQFGNQVIVENDDRERLGYGATEVYYDELRRGHTRETIVRPNGVQVITIRDGYGDIVRRSRVMPDGQEYVLIYADERGRDRPGRRGWRDPARELPPLRLNIPREQYILEAGQVRDYDRYYDFLDQPPVEPVRRLYSVDEVKYSSRVRDIARRVDIDTVTFDFGSASISESQIAMLEGIASAMERMLDEDPAETFLIEGHTDAVGSDQANLVLSDRRAESVAVALTNVFGIPPENLVTQGYGKRYLKIETQEAERRNRRVAVRRITPLVAPMAQVQ